MGVMIESHLVAGKQSLGAADLTYGQSITDGLYWLGRHGQLSGPACRSRDPARCLKIYSMRTPVFG